MQKVKETCFQVILVDDQESFRNLARTMLEGAGGFQIIAEATDGSEAVKLIEDIKPDFLLMDVEMEQMDGFEATRKIVLLNPAMRIVLTSMNGYKEYARMAEEVGALGFFAKRDLNPDVLRLLLQG